MSTPSDAHPPEIEFPCAVFDTVFHPVGDVLAVGLVSGRIELFRYSIESCDRVMTANHHKESCRGLEFSPGGDLLYSVSADRSLRAIDTSGSIAWQILDAHSQPINAMKLLGGTVLVTGDDDGAIKLWDARTRASIVTLSHHEDFIADFAVDPANTTLLAAGGDGRLSAMDLRKGKLIAMSDQIEDELLSVEIIKDGLKVVAGTQEGVLNIYNWGEWGDLNDRMLGHPNSIDSIVKIDEDTIATGSSDGLIRLVQLLPNKFLGVVGEHGDDPIERIRLSRDKAFMSSCSHDNTVKLWNVGYLFEGGEEGEDKEVGASFKAAGVDAPAGPPATTASAGGDMDVGEEDDEEEADEDGDSDSSDDSNGEDTGMPNGGAGASSSMRGRGGSSRPGKGARRNFFSDL